MIAKKIRSVGNVRDIPSIHNLKCETVSCTVALGPRAPAIRTRQIARQMTTPATQDPHLCPPTRLAGVPGSQCPDTKQGQGPAWLLQGGSRGLLAQLGVTCATHRLAAACGRTLRATIPGMRQGLVQRGGPHAAAHARDRNALLSPCSDAHAVMLHVRSTAVLASFKHAKLVFSQGTKGE